MDYKKKYNEAQKWIESIYSELSHEQQMEAEAFFPELKESKDERIRKEIIATIHLYYGESLEDEAKEMIAWLEKQGEPVEINTTEFDTRLQSLIGKFDSLPKEELIGSLSFWLNVVQNDGTYKSDEKQGEQKSIWHNEDEEPQRGSLILLIMQSGTPIVAKIIEPNHTFNHGERWAYIDDLLGKQGEQEEPQVYETEDGEIITYSESEGYKVVKPKFHEGDWITCEELNTALIVNIDNDRYEVEFIDGNKGFPHIDYIDRLFHLWSIQDAKDGDVLIDEDINVIGIFEGIEGMCWHSKFYYSNTTKEFYGIEYGGSHRKEFAKPATKEQRDTLMKVMADAGWEFDFEKKELKKISQRMVSAEAKEALYDKPAWSEEDEKRLQSCINILKAKSLMGKVDTANTMWLKSLKQRIGG